MGTVISSRHHHPGVSHLKLLHTHYRTIIYINAYVKGSFGYSAGYLPYRSQKDEFTSKLQSNHNDWQSPLPSHFTPQSHRAGDHLRLVNYRNEWLQPIARRFLFGLPWAIWLQGGCRCCTKNLLTTKMVTRRKPIIFIDQSKTIASWSATDQWPIYCCQACVTVRQ